MISTGCKSLDELLGGGYFNTIVLVYGGGGVGKTTLAMQAAVQALREHPESFVYYLDTELKTEMFNFKFSQLTKQWGLPQDVIQHVNRLTVDGFWEQSRQIQNRWLRESDVMKPCLFVIDSLTYNYQVELLKTSRSDRAVMSMDLQGGLAKQIDMIDSMSKKYDTPIILVSWPQSAASRSFREQARQEMIEKEELTDLEVGLGSKQFGFLGGRRLEFVAKIILRLFKMPDGERLVYLEKHTLMPEENLSKLKMTSKGLGDTDGKVYELNDYWLEMIGKARTVERAEEEERLKAMKKKAEITK